MIPTTDVLVVIQTCVICIRYNERNTNMCWISEQIKIYWSLYKEMYLITSHLSTNVDATVHPVYIALSPISVELPLCVILTLIRRLLLFS